MKNKKIMLVIFFVVLVYAAGGIYYAYFKKNPRVIKISNLDTIKGYNYVLKSNDTSLYKQEFNKLKENLESNDVNDEEYAESVAKMFIIDLYTLANKINKYDVGGTSFIHPDYLQNYKLNVQNSIYKYMEDNSNKNRTQELPEVIAVSVGNKEDTEYKIADESYNGYKFNLEWTYNKELGYDTNGEVIVIKQDNVYYVAEKN